MASGTIIKPTNELLGNKVDYALCKQSSPASIPLGGKYGGILLIGFTQSVGPTLWAVRIYNATITTIDLMTGAAPTATSPALSFDTTTNSLVITPENDANLSKYTIIIGNAKIS